MTKSRSRVAPSADPGLPFAPAAPGRRVGVYRRKHREVAAAIDRLRARGFRVMPAGPRTHKVVRGERSWLLTTPELAAFAAALPPGRPIVRRPRTAPSARPDVRQMPLFAAAPGPS